MGGTTEWIIENNWGPDWGENGYAKISSGKGDINLESHAFGMLINHQTSAEILDSQNTTPPPASPQEDENAQREAEYNEPADEEES